MRAAYGTVSAASGTLNGSEQKQGQQRAAITSRSGSDQSSSVTMTFSAAPGGNTRSKARSASEKGDAVADQLGEAFPVLGKCPRDLRGHVDGAACDGSACRPPMPLDRTAEPGEVSSG